MSRRSDLELTDSELMYQKRSATGSEEFAVQFRSTSSANVYLVFWPVMQGLCAGTAGRNLK